MWTRRALAGGLGAMGLTAGLLPGIARAASGHRKLVLVYNYGGWDPTRVLSAEFDNRAVDMERQAGEAVIGDLSFVEHPDRPGVSSFMERHAQRALIVNGVLMPSVAHENCLRLSLTGSSADGAPDFAAVAAGHALADYPLPHLVVGGPSFPGQMGAAVTRAGSSGQLEGLLSGDIVTWGEMPAQPPHSQAEAVMDRYLRSRAAAAELAAAPGRQQELMAAYGAALDRSSALEDLLHVMDWGAGGDLSSQSRMAVDALSLGISRCVTLSFTGASSGWDSHSDNDRIQSENFQALFSGLSELMDRLGSVPGEVEQTLAQETLVVVMSEMGRTPQLNEAQGKDHWPFTSLLLVGPGIAQGRSVGGLDSYGMGKLIDFGSGEIDKVSGQEIQAANLSATLLAMLDIDPGEVHPGVQVVEGLLG
ncbi:MAG: DUF1501 domain-containing protein [Myxococcota bacterium]|nr:DUF1501 domain-containing protein [Myxococcota bacterium]